MRCSAPITSIATRMVVEDGRYTGGIEYYAYGPTKAEAVRDLAASHGYDLSSSFAYSDSFTDLPMLEAVGHPHRGQPRQGAAEGRRGRSGRSCCSPARWPCADASQVRMRAPSRRLPQRRWWSAAAAGIVWYARRRSRTAN